MIQILVVRGRIVTKCSHYARYTVWRPPRGFKCQWYAAEVFKIRYLVFADTPPCHIVSMPCLRTMLNLDKNVFFPGFKNTNLSNLVVTTSQEFTKKVNPREFLQKISNLCDNYEIAYMLGDFWCNRMVLLFQNINVDPSNRCPDLERIVEMHKTIINTPNQIHVFCNELVRRLPEQHVNIEIIRKVFIDKLFGLYMNLENTAKPDNQRKE